MVLVLHVDFFALGQPSHEDLLANPINALTRAFFEIISIGAVNLFVLISGWYGIRPTRKGTCKFLYQSFFIITLVSVVGIASGNLGISRKVINESIFFSHAWFVTSYLGLYILSPLLNTFVTKASRREFETLLIGYFIFETYFGCFGHDPLFCEGYSPISFIGLYLLARYTKIYSVRWVKYAKILTFASLACNMLIFTIISYFGTGYTFYNLALGYTSPLVIISMLGLVMWTSTITPYHNRFINFVAASAFSVYLIHICNEWSTQLYAKAANYIYTHWSGIEYLAIIAAFMITVFVLAVTVDQLRILSWKMLSRL